MKKVEEFILEDIKAGDAICRAFMTGFEEPQEREASIIYKDGTEIHIKILSEDFARGLVDQFMADRR